MAENPYTRKATITIVEIVPDKGELPYCAAFTLSNDNCPFKSRYLQDGDPVCGHHMGKPSTWMVPKGDRK